MRSAQRWRRLFGAALFVLAALAAVPAAETGWVDLFNGRNLDGWIASRPGGADAWRVVDGVLDNSHSRGTNIFTEKWFRDFDLHVEFAMYPNSNAGLYLLNRYEVQMYDSYGKPPSKSGCGALYQTVAPSVNASKPAGEWQTFDIAFKASKFGTNGRKIADGSITVVHNGVTVLDNIALEAPTGAARRYDEEAAGPILIQGDHGPVKFRAIRLRGEVFDPPATNAAGPVVIDVQTSPTQSSGLRADGLALHWFTPRNAYASGFRIYRKDSPDVALTPDKFVGASPRRSFSDYSCENDGLFYYRIVALGADGKPGPPSAIVRASGKANQVATPVLAEAQWAATTGDRTPARNRSAAGKPIVMHGRQFETGIGMRSDAALRLNVNRLIGDKPHRLRATIGLDDAIPSTRRPTAASRFIIRIDGREAFDSGRMTYASGTKDVDVLVPAGARRLELIIQAEGERGQDYSNWADARLEPAA